MSDNTFLFLYGTLRDPELLTIVSGQPLASKPAWARGYLPRIGKGLRAPVITEAGPDDVTEGVLVEADEAATSRIVFYKSGFRLETLAVESGGGPVEARVFVAHSDKWEPGPVWSFAEWQAAFADRERDMAAEYLRLFGRQTAEMAGWQWGQIALRAAMRSRAAAAPSPDSSAG